MQLALDNPVRLAALIGVAAVAGGGMLVFKVTQGTSSAANSTPKLLHTSVGNRTHGRPKPKPKPHRVHRSPVAANGLPRAVADALVRNPIVVVSVVAPRGRVDALAVEEARAGAVASGAGFVRINAFRQSEIAPLQAKLGLKDNPALIVMRRPAVATLQVDGFVDRATVVQAVEDARTPR